MALLLFACEESDPIGHCRQDDPACEACDIAGLPCETGAALGGGGSFARLCAVTLPGPSCINVCKNRLLANAPRCAETRDCEQGQCLGGVCYDARHAGTVGDACEYDGDCADAFVCDNDQFRGSSCRCVVPCDAAHPQVGVALDLSIEPDEATWAEPDPDIVWHVERACCDASGATTRDSYTMLLFQDARDRSFVLGAFASLDGGQRVIGSFCGADLAWTASDDGGTLMEEGTWAYAPSTRFSGTSTVMVEGADGVERVCAYVGELGEAPGEPAAPECPSPP